MAGRRQAFIWNNAGILLIGPFGTNFNEMLIKICIFSFKKMHLKLSSGNWRPFCLSLNVLIEAQIEAPGGGGGGGGGGTHYLRVMGRLRGMDPPFSRHWKKNLDFRPPFFKVPAKNVDFRPPFLGF